MALEPGFLRACLAIGDRVKAVLDKLPTAQQEAVTAMYQRYVELVDRCRDLHLEIAELRLAATDVSTTTLDAVRGVLVDGAGARYCPVCAKQGRGLMPIQHVGIAIAEPLLQILGKCPSCQAGFPLAFS